ncbi:Imm26 family immunity protein [Cyclobacterium sp. 1_MG-2023]|uniref:Imm26 family immunity protein n=1 Tax=Cyclobacterium sp. 1_MG-2023 TaxID=3062681 RepID=UPI0026E2D60F|nr:Imm26 family immunity protein [Cyclobacterium sp. 1_MG-2023]MDO6437075.1 Imm26 family immunity protein [Cyclobacterium sp. 1_MG-2023]
MGPSVLIKLYALTSEIKEIDFRKLINSPTLPSDYIMDNNLFYGDYEIIGHHNLVETDFEFPVSYGKSIDYAKKTVFLQWGLIHKEIPLSEYNKYIETPNPKLSEKTTKNITNPFGYYSIGFSTRYDTKDIKRTEETGTFEFDLNKHFKAQFDLRNPKNEMIRNEIFKRFDLDPSKDYIENCKRTNTPSTLDVISKLQ